ncbi:ATP-binding protein [Nonomuraea wenchangensis]
MSTPGPEQEADLAQALRNFVPGSEPLATELRTSQRVLARVTDGIYRQPGSALRELISNAYDADATRVTISMDRPRFDRITISDDGMGMSPEVLKHLLHNIGGSAKRTDTGKALNMTSEQDTNLSPKGRPLIGKIGIGLFSVAQLTQSFQISTKVAGDRFQSVARVLLRQFSDATAEVDEDGQYKAGRVLLWTEPAEDVENQGTTITLTSVRPQTREALRSEDLWHRVTAAAEGRSKQAPMFHVGVVESARPDVQTLVNNEYERLPWQPSSGSNGAFEQFVTAPLRALEAGRRNAQLENIFDDYLRMAWNLALSAPLPYVAGHPFDAGADSGIDFFLVNGRSGDEAVTLSVPPEKTLREVLPFDAPDDPAGFEVHLDELSLKRPITLAAPPPTSAALQRPMLFVGHYRTDYPMRAIELSGGPLEFSAYLFWTPRLLPPEHSGVLIRVNEASGTLFDPKFLGFPSAEERRMSQVLCEVFVREGFDGALNIDRESFNQTHPHVVTITRWVHGALRQLIATHKRLGKSARHQRRRHAADDATAQVQARVDQVWENLELDGEPPPVHFGAASVSVLPGDRGFTWPEGLLGDLSGPNREARKAQREEIVAALTQILEAYGVWDSIEPLQQAEMLKALYDVIAVHLK